MTETDWSGDDDVGLSDAAKQLAAALLTAVWSDSFQLLPCPSSPPPTLIPALQIMDAKIWRRKGEEREVALRKGKGGRSGAWQSWPHSVSDVVETQQ